MNLTWRFDATSWENIELEKQAGEVITKLTKFFETRPKNVQRPQLNKPPPNQTNNKYQRIQSKYNKTHT
jgi:hypothetical protein